MSQLKQQYDRIIAMRRTATTGSKPWHEIYAEKRESMMSLFKEAFSSVIPLLEEDGIQIAADYQDNYNFLAPYIQFKKGNKLLLMDFCGLELYRYECGKFNFHAKKYYHPGSQFKPYPIDDFIVWIVEMFEAAQEPRIPSIINPERQVPQQMPNVSYR
jgi:hypothetical protein